MSGAFNVALLRFKRIKIVHFLVITPLLSYVSLFCLRSMHIFRHVSVSIWRITISLRSLYDIVYESLQNKPSEAEIVAIRGGATIFNLGED